MTNAIKPHLQSLCNNAAVDCLSFFVTSDVGFYDTFGVDALVDSESQGWTEERGPTLGIIRNKRPYTEGVVYANGTRTCYFTNNFSHRCGDAFTLVPRGWAKRLTRSSSAVQRNSLPI
jgi:hypothetical protein